MNWCPGRDSNTYSICFMSIKLESFICPVCNQSIEKYISPRDKRKSKTGLRFCSRKCSASYTNSKFPKRTCTNLCKCGKTISSSFSLCKECSSKFYYSDFTTIDSIREKTDYQKSARIRYHARKKYLNSDKPKECTKCGYSKHFEVCHIKAINSFEPTATLGEVNSLTNLIALCPNCHWEFDHSSS